MSPFVGLEQTHHAINVACEFVNYFLLVCLCFAPDVEHGLLKLGLPVPDELSATLYLLFDLLHDLRVYDVVFLD